MEQKPKKYLVKMKLSYGKVEKLCSSLDEAKAYINDMLNKTQVDAYSYAPSEDTVVELPKGVVQ